ncbi:MAG: WD40 repeat domain-containing protein [Planctomycetes bacterium]|nr:WD40 repeat domain-containing protein [Planctomycetota bacterium]
MLIATGIVGTMLLTSPAQTAGKKDKEPVKGPMFPPINPAIARLDITITGLEGPGFAIAYSSTSDLLVASCENGIIQAFKKEAVAAFKGGTGKAEVMKGHDGPVRTLAWNGGPVLASIGVDKKVIFWKMPEGKAGPVATVDYRIRAAAMSGDGKTLATAGESASIQLWDVAAGKPTTKLTEKSDWTLCVAFSADGKQLLSGDMSGVVRLWDVGGKKIKDLPAPPTPAPKTLPDPVPATAVAFAPDGKTAVIGMSDGPIHLINLGDGKILRTFAGHTAAVSGITFHPSGTLMATCSRDRTVKLWNPAAPAPLKSLDGHTAWIEGITFTDNGTRLATVAADQTVRIWDLTEAPKKK